MIFVYCKTLHFLVILFSEYANLNTFMRLYFISCTFKIVTQEIFRQGLYFHEFMPKLKSLQIK